MTTHKTIVVMPAYNAERTLSNTINDVPLAYVDEIILVDDASSDGTIPLAQKIAMSHPQLQSSLETSVLADKTLFTIVRHEVNKGYGGNQKTCYETALAHGATIVVMLHPDYQYDPKLVKYFVEFIRDGYFDVMLGSRIRSRKEALAGGMPRYKYYANRLLSCMQNIASGQSLSEWHTGMRAYTREVLESVPYKRFSDDFVFDTQMLFGIVERGFAVGDIPVPVRYFEKASSINFSRSVRYGLLTVWETVKFVIRTAWRPFRYVVAGGLAFGTNMGAYVFLLHYAQVAYLPASYIAFWTGALVSFSLHKYWTFERASLRGTPRELGLYLVLLAVNSSVNAVLLYTFIELLSFDAVTGNIISNILVAVLSFFLLSRVVFRTVPAE